MKYKLSLLILSLFLVSCVYEEDSTLQKEETANVNYKELGITIDTGLTEKETKAGEGGDANVVCAAEVKIERVRLYYFNGIAYLSNKLFTVSSTTGTASFTALVPDISALRIIAIVNEPTSMSTTLEGLKTRDAILTAKYSLSNYMTKNIYTVNSTSWGFTTLPFFAEVSSINATTAKSISIQVERCMSRVDVYFKKATDLGTVLKMTTATTCNISNASSTGAFGNLTSVTLVPVNFTADKLLKDLTLTTTAQRVYYYYMVPCGNVVNPSMTINNVSYTDYQYTKNFTVSNFIKGGIEENKIYRIYCTIGSGGEISISNITIANWSDVTVDGDIHGSEIILPGGSTYVYIQKAVGSNITVPVISRGVLSMSRFICRRNEVYEYYKYSNSTYTYLSETSPKVVEEAFTLAKLPVWVNGGISLTYSKTYNGLSYYNLSVTKKGNHITYGGYVAVTSSTTPKPPTGATHRRLRIEEKRVSVYLKCDVSEKAVTFDIN